MVKKEEFLRENGFEKEGQEEVSRSDFPSDFVFGVATSAYQVCRQCRFTLSRSSCFFYSLRCSELDFIHY